MPSPETQRVEEQVDIALANLMFSGLSIAQMDKIPKWLLKNMDKNKPKFKEILHTSLVAAVEGKKRPTVCHTLHCLKGKAENHDMCVMNVPAVDLAYNQALEDTLTIINSIFKE